MKYFKYKILPHIIAIFLLLVIDAAYFAPHFIDGKKIEAADALSSTAWSKQTIDYHKESGERAYWNPSMFSGMPWGLLTYGAQYNLIAPINKILYLGANYPLGLFFKMSLIGYLSLIVLGISPWIAFWGTLMYMLNVNFTILIEAGHQSKLDVIANFPLIISGIILCFRSKFILGTGIVALAASLSILRNHIQMVYYLLICLTFFVAIYGGFMIKEGRTKILSKGIAVLVIAALIGGLSNLSQLSSSKTFSEDTMRGKPILSELQPVKGANSSSDVQGLNWNYAMQWSNGFQDIVSIVIPSVVGGGSSQEVKANSETGRLLRQNKALVGKDGNVKGAPMYWGSLPFTSGPYYVGVVILVFFILSFFINDKRLSWSVGISVFILFVLSMGKNAAWLNQTLFDFLPLFNKFRAPNSAMNIVPVFLFIPAALGLQGLLEKSKKFDRSFLKMIYISSGIIAGIGLLYFLLGSSFLSFISETDSRYSADVAEVFRKTRKNLMQQDAGRVIFLSLLIGGLFWAFLKKYLSFFMVLVFLIMIGTIDNWTVNRRYLDGDKYTTARNYDSNFNPRSVDQQIFAQEQKGRGYYRVFDLSINTFNSAHTSYHHNTVGGYHAAKLQRYQDMIDYYISKGNQSVLNMLNTKYIINKSGQLQINSQAYGSAWFIQKIERVNSPNEEINTVGNTDLRNAAVVLATEFGDLLDRFVPGDGKGKIELTDYKPNHMIYSSSSENSQSAVFSEVYYDGWKAKIDGVPTDIIRVNYLLRCVQIPAGDHVITFDFEPEAQGVWITMASSGLIILMLLFLLYEGIQYWRSNPQITADDSFGLLKPTKSISSRKKNIQKRSTKIKGSKK